MGSNPREGKQGCSSSVRNSRRMLLKLQEPKLSAVKTFLRSDVQYVVSETQHEF